MASGRTISPQRVFCRSRSRAVTVLRRMSIIAVIAIIALAVFFASVLHKAKQSIVANHSTQAMKNVWIALEAYYAQNDSLPSSITTIAGHDHSWRMLVENGHGLSNVQYDLSESWDSAINLKLADNTRGIPFSGFDALVRHKDIRPFPPTNYFVVSGPQTAFPAQGCVRLENIADGVENTVLVIELGRSKIPWPMPRDVAFRELEQLYRGTHELSLDVHTLGCGLLFADWERFYMIKKLPFEVFQALFTISGNDGLTRDKLLRDGYLVPMSGV